MRAFFTASLGKIAVKTKDLEVILGIAVVFQPTVDIHWFDSFSVVSTISVDVIHAQERTLVLTTTDTFSTIGCQSFNP